MVGKVTLHRILYGTREQAEAQAKRWATSAGLTTLDTIEMHQTPMPPPVVRWTTVIQGSRDA